MEHKRRLQSSKFSKPKKKRVTGTAPKQVAVCIIVFCCLVIASVFLINNYKIFNYCKTDDFFVQSYEGNSIIKRVVKIKEPDKLPVIKNPEDAIIYVQFLDYNLFITDPVQVLKEQKGNCLGKARLLYFIGKKNNYKFEFIKNKECNHIKVKYNEKIYDL